MKIRFVQNIHGSFHTEVKRWWGWEYVRDSLELKEADARKKFEKYKSGEWKIVEGALVLLEAKI